MILKIPIISTAQDGWRKAKKSFSKERKSYRRFQQYKSFWYALLNPFFASQWFKILNSSRYLYITEHRPRLYMKPFRVYMSTKWNIHQRLKVILDTYDFLISKGNKFSNFAIQGKKVTIASFFLKDGTEAKIILEYDECYRKEGELVFSLISEKYGGTIAGISFSFEKVDSEKWICRIGCIQGNKMSDNSNAIKLMQLQMHGLRPKSLMIFIVQEFARKIGVQSIFGVGSSIQAFKRKHAIHIPWLHSINFDYDAIWNECGGTYCSDGWYLLPSIPVRKSIDQVKSSKRAYYRRRYEMFDKISQEISISLKEIMLD